MKVSGVLSLRLDEKYNFIKFEVTSDQGTILVMQKFKLTNNCSQCQNKNQVKEQLEAHKKAFENEPL